LVLLSVFLEFLHTTHATAIVPVALAPSFSRRGRLDHVIRCVCVCVFLSLGVCVCVCVSLSFFLSLLLHLSPDQAGWIMSLGVCVCVSLSLFCGIFLLTTWAR